MRYFKFVFRSRSPAIVFKRLWSIIKRFGITQRRFQKYLTELVDIMKPFGSRPTLAITAKILERHSQMIKKMSDEGIEFAIHGYFHKDHSQMSYEQQFAEFWKAKEIFNKSGVPFRGFRAPYLRWNNDTLKAVEDHHFQWDSNAIIHWDVLEESEYSKTNWQAYKNASESLYRSNQAADALAMPTHEKGYVEIPVSIPDDEILRDRLCINDIGNIEEIWSRILRETHERGELFTIQMHPERAIIFSPVLKSLLKQAANSNPPIWIAQLHEIADWWREKNHHSFKIHEHSVGEYRIGISCPEKAMILARNVETDVLPQPFDSVYQRIDTNEFTIKNDTKPIIGYARDSSPEFKRFLREEGFFAQEVQPGYEDRYAKIFNDKQNFSDMEKRLFLDNIEASDMPVIRVWRWPQPYRSALAITGDIDAITIFDFIMRVFEF